MKIINLHRDLFERALEDDADTFEIVKEMMLLNRKDKLKFKEEMDKFERIDEVVNKYSWAILYNPGDEDKEPANETQKKIFYPSDGNWEPAKKLYKFREELNAKTN